MSLCALERHVAFVAKKRNPIIFARTETSHIPKTLQHLQHPKELQNAVYSAHVDGSLKRTPSSPAVEEERQAEQTTESLSVRAAEMTDSGGSVPGAAAV